MTDFEDTPEPGEPRGPTTGEYKIVLAHHERGIKLWKRVGIVATGIASLLGLWLLLNSVGPCRNDWAFADKAANETFHVTASKRLDGHDDAIKTLKGTVTNIDSTTWQIWCATEHPGTSDAVKNARKRCLRERPKTTDDRIEP
jgi:hypothetical protein